MCVKLVLFHIVLLTSSSMNISAIRLCGFQLSNALQLICEEYGGYHYHTKREISSAVYQGTLSSLVPVKLRRRLPWHHIAKRGIVDECCKNDCSFYTLTSYCANPNGKAVGISFDIIVCLVYKRHLSVTDIILE